MTLSIYSIKSITDLPLVSDFLHLLGTGVYHCGVVVYGCEWSFGGMVPTKVNPDVSKMTGVFSCPPQGCDVHVFNTSMMMGHTMFSELDVRLLIRQLRSEWTVETYDMMSNNCCHFCDALCQRLGVGMIPPWLLHIANAGAAAQALCCRSSFTPPQNRSKPQLAARPVVARDDMRPAKRARDPGVLYVDVPRGSPIL